MGVQGNEGSTQHLPSSATTTTSTSCVQLYGRLIMYHMPFSPHGRAESRGTEDKRSKNTLCSTATVWTPDSMAPKSGPHKSPQRPGYDGAVTKTVPFLWEFTAIHTGEKNLRALIKDWPHDIKGGLGVTFPTMEMLDILTPEDFLSAKNISSNLKGPFKIPSAIQAANV